MEELRPWLLVSAFKTEGFSSKNSRDMAERNVYCLYEMNSRWENI